MPSLTSYAVTKKNQVSATFHLVGTTLAFVYYVYGHIGMPEPLFSDVQSQAFNETLNYSDPVYGVTYIKNTARDVDFTLTRLTPGISYTIYFYIMNLNKVFNPQAYQLNFTTDGNLFLLFLGLMFEKTRINPRRLSWRSRKITSAQI